jgi:hypothetical protein
VARRKSSAGITIGFFGTGEMDVGTAQTLIDEHLKPYGDDPLHFIFVVHTDEFSDTIGELIQLAVNSEIPYEAVTSPGDKRRNTFSDVLTAASKTHSVEDPVEFLKATLSEAPGGRLFMLWDKEREDEMQEIATSFLEAKIPTYDLTDAMTEIGFPEQAQAEEAEAEETTEMVYSKSELQKLGRDELWQIADRLGVKRSRASATTIEDILEAQEAPSEVPEEPEEPPAEEEEEEVPASAAAMPEEVWERLDKSLDRFSTNLISALEVFITKLPPSPTPSEPEPPRRVLSRARR